MGPPAPGQLENVTNLIFDFLKLKANEGKGLPDTPLSPPYVFQHPETPLSQQTTPGHPKQPTLSPQGVPWLLPALVRESERHLSCQLISEGNLGEMRVSEDACWVSGMFVSVFSCLWQCLGYVRGDMGLSRDIWGCLGEVGGTTGGWDGYLAVFSLHLPSILGGHRLDSWHFPVDLAVPDVSNIKML